MTSRVSPKLCSLRTALGEREVCPGEDCAFWEHGGAVVESGCAIERLGVPVADRRDVARHLLDLRVQLERARDDQARRDAHRRFSELLNLNRE